jgi:hypothetical protein
VVTWSGRMSRSERMVRRELTPVGIHIGLGTVAVLLAAMAAATVPVNAGGWRLLPVAAVLCLFGVWTVDWVAVAVVAALAYLLIDGFLVNHFGILSWDGTPAVYRLVVVSMSAGVGLAVGAVRHGMHERRRFTIPRSRAAGQPVPARDLQLLADKEEVPGV